MKLKVIIFALILTVLSTATFAQQSSNDPIVKILPLPTANMLKLLYVNDVEGAVQVKFYSGNALIKRDKIRGRNFEKGFVKKYDLSDLKAGIYQVEVISGGMSVKYELSVNPGQPLWARTWENHLSPEQAIASK